VQEWSGLYSGIDVLGECKRALAWVYANQPKTASGMPAFLVRWLNTAADRPRAAAPLMKDKPDPFARLRETHWKATGTDGAK
jgi:hypothetical protein